MNTLRLSLAGFCLLVAAGCSKSGGDATASTNANGATPAAAAPQICDSRSENGKCSEFKKPEEADANKAVCEMFKGTWSSTPCPQSQAIASCTEDEKTLYYFKGKTNSGLDVDTDFAKIDCEMVSGKLALMTPAASPAAAPAAVAAKGGKKK